MSKSWIRLFSINDRSFLEEQLNQFIRDHDVVEIVVWNDISGWYAQVRYSFPESPTYCRPENDDD